MENSQHVVVRLRWDAPQTAAVAAAHLSDLHVRAEPGGVCGALPRGFLYGRVWCDRLAAGALGHACHAGSGPHELLVCILPGDNAAGLMQKLRTRSRG